MRSREVRATSETQAVSARVTTTRPPTSCGKQPSTAEPTEPSSKSAKSCPTTAWAVTPPRSMRPPEATCLPFTSGNKRRIHRRELGPICVTLAARSVTVPAHFTSQRPARSRFQRLGPTRAPVSSVTRRNTPIRLNGKRMRAESSGKDTAQRRKKRLEADPPAKSYAKQPDRKPPHTNDERSVWPKQRATV